MAWGEANPQLIELVQSLHRITGLKFVIYNASRQILASEPPTMCTFCTEIRKSPVLAQRCLVCDAAGFDRCDRTGQPCTYHCHMNVQEMIAPIRDKQYRIGYVMIGQFLDYDDRTELHRRAADAAAQFGLDRARLDHGAEELQRYDEAYLRSVMQLLEMSASYIWMNQILDVSRDSLSYNLSCYIQEHLADPLSVAGLSRTFGLSSSALYQLSKQRFGCGIAAYVNRCRIVRACQLLRSTDRAIGDVASAVGVYDVNYFIRLFKKITGTTPRRYSANPNAEIPVLGPMQ